MNLFLTRSRVPANEQGQVSYEEFTRLMNWRDHPVAPPPQQRVTGGGMDENWQGNRPGVQVQSVNLGLFLRDICGGK